MMKIEVRGTTFPITGPLEEHITRRVDFALRRFAGQVDRVVVRLADLNGPKGGPDKRCRIAARLTTATPDVIVEATDADAYAAVSLAAARLDERVTRTLSKKHALTPAARAAGRRWHEEPVLDEAAQRDL